MKKNIILVIAGLFLLMIGSAYACVEPTSYINSDTILCKGEYNLPSGIIIGQSVSLDCDGATLIGSLERNGITVLKDNTKVENCNIQGYERGIFVEADNVILLRNTLKDNVIGVYFFNSENYINDNIYIDNTENIFEAARRGGDGIAEILPVKIDDGEVLVEPESIVYETTAQAASRLNIEHIWEFNVDRVGSIVDGKVQYTLTISVEKEVVGLKIYEIIPKEVASSASLISSSFPFEIINDDPEIVFVLGNVQPGEDKVITYVINSPELSKVNPFSIASIERFVNPNESIAIRILFALGLVLFLINHFVKKEIVLRTSGK